ncbi:Monoacylglycerol lipase [Gracilariopsis chorda]|uniref:Monoacylglycerol lipase n=1 Tax=Gracilariopsis chorda TaxID=448386 RepID=A0A2V3ING1_9FLOR|nr:Monoacylglycerol lipase [Gracilariopsis chorda]|eukprot:PXF43616.1 Monoacylglycerol lipase [Gracilariopsis chorda]
MPIQEQTELLQFRDPDQPNLHTVFWTREALSEVENPKLLVWNHGIGEHSARYRRFAETILSHVPSLHAVISFDMRNHGHSDGIKGATRNITDFVKDLYELVLPRVSLKYGPNSSVVIGGHSLGGAIVAGAMSNRDCLIAESIGQLSGVILSAPAIEIVVSGAVNKALQPFAPFLVRIPGSRGFTKGAGIDPNDLCQDKEIVEAYVNDPLVHDKISVGVGADLLTYGTSIVDTVKQGTECVLNSVPVLVLHGKVDKITRIEGSKKLVDAINHKGHAKMIEIDGAFHEAFNEKPEMGSSTFYDSVCEFLNSVLT